MIRFTHPRLALGTLALEMQLVDGQHLLEALTLGLARGTLPGRIVLSAQRVLQITRMRSLALATAQIARIFPILVPAAQAAIVQAGKAARDAQRQVICAPILAQKVALTVGID